MAYVVLKSGEVFYTDIPFAFQVTAALAARTHPSHVLLVHAWDSIDCRLAVTRNSLGIYHCLGE
ncbi:hypothetical protein CCS41_03945 [Candidatus Fukatsuia symbiotica]|uniref:Uncharacterized protein n=1 Tax=Candidatus Fukatsuia symbiotica TaxID=1878942 RepID=A0A2U8I816_9GAMM|nr:hypothetical protein CCS41_03945 [Candidatus Fukatsuia symbiotica]